MVDEGPPAPADVLPGGRPVASVRFLLRDSAVYGLSNALVKLTALVTVPIMTRTLSQADYGATDALAVMLALLVAFSTLGQDSAVARFFYDTERREDRRQVVSQGLAAQLAMCAIVAGMALAVAGRVLRSPSGEALGSAYYIVVACLPAVLLFQFWRGLLKWMLARTQYVVLSVGTSLLNLAAIGALAATGHLDVRTFFWAMLATNALSAVAGLWMCREYVTLPRELAFLGPMLRFGAPYAAVLIVGTLLPAVDRAIVTSKLGLEPLATYAVGMKYASLLLFPVMAFQTAWGPFCYATYKDPAAPAVYGRVLALLAGGLGLTCFALVALAEPLIALLASPTYLPAAPLVIPIAFGLAAEACSWILGIGIDLSKRSHLSLASYLVGLGVAVPAALLLVGIGGILGVAVGIGLGRLAQSIVYSILGRRAYPLRIPWRKPLISLGAALALSGVVMVVRPDNAAATAGVRLVAFAVLLLVVVSGLGPAERAQLRAITSRFRRGHRRG